ncbi:hypothetical protein GCM10023172_02120 [Hymenobacter ginsengisoli]|uniref:Outer membrane protein beta-barrel domain-containing protein n=1 Tax=Hymenobacter ginsengisoli TaxID=1051626 RepID=A0ABP8PWB2_9BACT
MYAPMQPVMPLVRQRGQVEVGASAQLTGRVEATAAYSPVQRVVVAGGLTAAPRLSDQHFLVTRQYEVGAGLYQPLGRRWLLSGLGGGGQAYCHRGYVDLGIFGSGVYSEYEARYSKYFGQLGVAHIQQKDTYSLNYRFTQVNFDYLTDAEYGPLPLSAMTRHELALSVRSDIGKSRRWQLVTTLGLSVASTSRQDDNQSPYNESARHYHANRNLLPAFLMSFGVVYQPKQSAALY